MGGTLAAAMPALVNPWGSLFDLAKRLSTRGILSCAGIIVLNREIEKSRTGR